MTSKLPKEDSGQGSYRPEPDEFGHWDGSRRGWPNRKPRASGQPTPCLLTITEGHLLPGEEYLQPPTSGLPEAGKPVWVLRQVK